MVKRVQSLFANVGVDMNTTDSRELKHGVFIPFKLVYPSMTGRAESHPTRTSLFPIPQKFSERFSNENLGIERSPVLAFGPQAEFVLFTSDFRTPELVNTNVPIL